MNQQEAWSVRREIDQMAGVAFCDFEQDGAAVGIALTHRDDPRLLHLWTVDDWENYKRLLALYHGD